MLFNFWLISGLLDFECSLMQSEEAVATADTIYYSYLEKTKAAII